MASKVISSATIGSFMSNGKNIAVKYATKTDTWTRPHLSQSVQDELKKAIEKAHIPANATSAIMAEKEHPSTSDSKSHFTTVFQDENGEWEVAGSGDIKKKLWTLVKWRGGLGRRILQCSHDAGRSFGGSRLLGNAGFGY